MGACFTIPTMAKIEETTKNTVDTIRGSVTSIYQRRYEPVPSHVEYVDEVSDNDM
jgi:hypothetical protein